MQLNGDGWSRRVGYLRRIKIAVRIMKLPLCWWCNISLPPGEFGGRGLMPCSSGTLDPHAHPFFAEIAHLRVSAHCLIRRDGEIVQYVLSTSARGTRCFVITARALQRFSIGIELEGTDELAYTDAQYQQLAVATRQLILLYPAMTISPAIAILRQCVKRIPARLLTGKFRALLTPSSE